jgi:hypothetical protein
LATVRVWQLLTFANSESVFGGGKLLGMHEEASRQHLYGRDVASASYGVGKH